MLEHMGPETLRSSKACAVTAMPSSWRHCGFRLPPSARPDKQALKDREAPFEITARARWANEHVMRMRAEYPRDGGWRGHGRVHCLQGFRFSFYKNIAPDREKWCSSHMRPLAGSLATSALI